MVDRLNKVKKSKEVKSETNHPARQGELAKKTREKMRGLGQLEKFEKSEIGQGILATFGSVSQILESEDSLNPVLEMLEFVSSDDAGRETALVFLKVASKKFPDMMRDRLRDTGFDSRLRDRLIAEMGWDPLELSIEAVVPAKPRQAAEKKDGVDNSALVKEMVESEGYKGVLDKFDAEDLMDSLKRSHSAIDLDSVVLSMPEFSVKGIMAYLKKKKITISRPKLNSLEALMSDPKKLEKAFDRLGYIYGDVDPRHFGAFALMVAEKNPKFVFGYYSRNPYAQVRDADSKAALVKLLVEKGYPAKNSLFEEPPAE